ncbi:MAG: Uma2 family endonuclease [Planctomycetes bacterium]|nr:Uma2 family endonuclease [Planctomycetota bacterium]
MPVPSLVIEVDEPEFRWGRMIRRVNQFLAAGVPAVGILQPTLRTLTIFRPGTEPIDFEPEQDLSSVDFLPGFRCRVADFFEDASAHARRSSRHARH